MMYGWSLRKKTVNGAAATANATANPEDRCVGGNAFVVEQEQDLQRAEQRLASRNQNCVLAANYVGVCDFGRVIHATAVAQAIDSRMDYQVFADMVSRVEDAHTTCSTFSQGHSIIIGCRTETHALYTAYLLRYTLWEMTGELVSMLNFSICNQVCRVEFPFSIPNASNPHEPLPPTGGLRISMLKTDLVDHPCTVNGKVFFDPDVFYGLRWTARLPWADGTPNPEGREITFVLFERGRGVATGLVTEEDRWRANDLIVGLCAKGYERGNEYRKPTSAELADEKRNEENRAKKRAQQQQKQG